jgi:DNA-binding transcriptional regulator LsrR (DeoR family)
VNKIIGQARANGSVHIEIRMPLAACVELEEEVKARYGLVDAIVVPSIHDVEQQKQVIGEAAGRMLEALLRDGQSIGVGWGRTLVAVAKRLTPRQFRRSHVVSVMGGQTRGSGTNTFEVASELARALGAECHYIPPRSTIRTTKVSPAFLVTAPSPRCSTRRAKPTSCWFPVVTFPGDHSSSPLCL